MKWFIFAAGLTALASAVCGAIQAAERSVILPRDATPFKAGSADIVRVTGKGIAGAKVVAAVEGPAKVDAENRISERSNGHPMIGLNVREFEIKATGKGHVKVTITVTPPQPGIPPNVSSYEYDVE